jgi:predicted XRE-type DNA-binding protein
MPEGLKPVGCIASSRRDPRAFPKEVSVKEMESKVEDGTVFYGSGNVFADLDMPNTDERLAKAGLASAIQDVIESRGLTQAEAASIMGIDQPKVSKIIRGRLSEFSTERLLNFLVQLGLDVEIVIHKQSPQTQLVGKISVACV